MVERESAVLAISLGVYKSMFFSENMCSWDNGNVGHERVRELVTKTESHLGKRRQLDMSGSQDLGLDSTLSTQESAPSRELELCSQRRLCEYSF